MLHSPIASEKLRLFIGKKYRKLDSKILTEQHILTKTANIMICQRITIFEETKCYPNIL